MTRYIASEANLKMMMNLLRDKSKNIQFEAFHVFKVGRRVFVRSSIFSRSDTPRCLWQTRRSHLKSKQSSGAIRITPDLLEELPQRQRGYVPENTVNPFISN
jgi:hypothetical protein